MNIRRLTGRGDEDGSSVVELLVAAGLTVTALGVLLGNVVMPIDHLLRAHDLDVSSIELRDAGEEVARLVRAARPGITEPAAITDGDRAIVLRVVDHGRIGHVRIALVDDRLEIESMHLDGSTVQGSARTLVAGLVPDTGQLVVHLDSSEVASEHPVAVGLHLRRDGSALDRVTALRMVTYLDGAGGW